MVDWRVKMLEKMMVGSKDLYSVEQMAFVMVLLRVDQWAYKLE